MTHQAPAKPAPIEPIALTLNDAAAAIGVSRSHLYRLSNAGKLQLKRVGGRTVVLTAHLRALLESEAA